MQKFLAAANYQVNIELTEPLPQNRAVQMLEQGNVSMLQLIQSAERDVKYASVDVDLTNKLIAHRILLIPPGQDKDYAAVKDLEDFRQLGKIGAFQTQPQAAGPKPFQLAGIKVYTPDGRETDDWLEALGYPADA